MSNIAVRRTPNESPARREHDPFRIAREMLRWDPFQELTASLPAFEKAFAPDFEVKETKDAYVFKADLPGVEEKDLEITMTGNRLAVGGKREAEKEEKGETYFTYERSYGSFTRSFTLPDGVDAQHIRADLKDGVLSLIVPKRAEAQPRKIEVGKSGSVPSSKH